MDRLWAGWRMAYIEAPRRKARDGKGRGGKDRGSKGPGGKGLDGRAGTRSSACLFCGLAKAKPGPRNLVLATSPRALVMLNLYPYNVGHVMVAPTRHVGSLAGLRDEERLEMDDWLGRVETALRSAYRPHGFNVGMNLGRSAGAGVLGHVHWHVVPRWNGDTNFMPVTATTKVLPEPLDRTYRRIAEALASEDAPARRRKRPRSR